MDRVLTGLFARIHHRGEDSRLFKRDTTIATFLDHFLANPKRFKDFDKYPAITRGWLETHLLDLVNRGKPGKEAVAAPRPLHGFTYRFRNPKHCRDYGAAQHLYETLWHARNDLGKRAIARLRGFFFEGIEPPRSRAVSTTYVVCLDCGEEFPYDWQEMKMVATARNKQRAVA
jgi:hypothetical protein